MEAKDKLTVRLKSKHDPDKEHFDVKVLDLTFRDGYSVLVLQGPPGNPLIELRTFYYEIAKITYTDDAGGTYSEEFDGTLVEQGEAIDVIKDYVSGPKSILGSRKSGPPRVEVSFKYRSQIGRGTTHTGVVVYATGPAGAFVDYHISIRNWTADGMLAKTRTSVSSKNIVICSVAAYTAQATMPFKAQKFEEGIDPGCAEVLRLFSALTEAEKRVAENWECPYSSSVHSQSPYSRAAGPAYGTSYSTYGYVTPKPASCRKRGDAQCLADWETTKKAMGEGKILLSLQAVEGSEKKVPETSSAYVSTVCVCGSPRCYECNPDLAYIH